MRHYLNARNGFLKRYISDIEGPCVDASSRPGMRLN